MRANYIKADRAKRPKK